MTITTAKLSRAVRQAWTRPLALSALLLAPVVHAVDLTGVEATLDSAKSTLDGADLVKPSANSWRIVPTLELRQIFTDNISLQPAERAHSQFLTDISPGVTVNHRSRRLKVEGDTQLHFYANAKEELGTRRSSSQLRGAAKAELVDDMVFVDASASMFQQSISPFAQLVSNNEYASANRANVKTWQVSPYLVNRFGRVARSELRYLHDSVDAGSRSGLGNTEGDTVSYRLTSGPSWNDLTWGLSASQQQINDEVLNDSNIKTASVNLGYQLLPTFAVTAAAFYDDYDYESVGGANGGRGHSAGIRWTPSRRTSIDASWGQRYYGPSRMLKAMHRSRRTIWNLSYDDSIVTTRANFLLPGAIDPLTGFPTPTAPGLGNPGGAGTVNVVSNFGTPTRSNVNFFSNRFSLQKQLRASVALRGGRSSAVVNLYKVRREALSVREVDADLLGTPVDTLTDNIEQVGLNAVLTYRLSPRSDLNLSAEVADNESITTGFQARSSATRLLLNHRIGRNMFGVAELRRVTGATGLTSGARYTENAVSVSLNMKL